ncbi:MAG: Smr/MutS family protein [Gammaproteobacteria bacterium]
MSGKPPITDDELFRQAMQGVKPLGKGSKAPDDHLPPARKKSPAPPTLSLKRYYDRPNAPAVSGNTVLDFCDPSLPYRDRRRLKKGQIPIEASLDLHGMTLETARGAFSLFLAKAQANHYRCVHVIHGKGKDDAPPVLKNGVYQWLPQSACVLAYCSAQPKDGGTGAVYVLLRDGEF